MHPDAHEPLALHPPAAPVVGALPSSRAAELARSLAVCDPLRTALDVAVRRFVRAERGDGRSLESILDTLAGVLRRDVEPRVEPAHRAALQHAVAWFAVSEFHRAD
jgi:hypothetical protein